MKIKEYIKSHGLPGMTHIAKLTGKDRRTLYKWYHDNFPLFEIIVLGCVSKGTARASIPFPPIIEDANTLPCPPTIEPP